MTQIQIEGSGQEASRLKEFAKHVLKWPSDDASHEVQMIQAVAAADKLDDTTAQHVWKSSNLRKIKHSWFILMWWQNLDKACKQY